MPTIDEARNWYSENDPVHGYHHIMRVYRMAERLARAENADLEIVRAAALLHDAEGPGVGETRLEHQHASAFFAGEPPSRRTSVAILRRRLPIGCIAADRTKGKGS